MKNFSIALLVLFGSFALASAAPASAAESLLNIRLVIDHNTTEAELEQMQQFLQDNGYEMRIESREYAEDGSLKSIRGEVDFGSTSGSFHAKDLSQGTLVIKKSILGKLSIEIKPSE